MSARLAGTSDREKLEALCRKTYKEQAIWFLNGFWEKLGAEKEALVIYEYVKKCHSLDLDKKAEGNELDELQAHRFLESFQKTLTVQSMRDQLRKTGAIGDKIKNVPLSHLLLVLYNVHFKDLINASQGNQEEIEKAQRLLEAVNTALRESEAKAEAARQALKEAETRETEAKQREVEAKQREAEAQAAKQELEAALAELKAQEDAYNNKTEDLKRKSEEGTVVQKNKAKNELAQHLAEDPLPLRRAKINQEAAVRKAEKTAKAAAEARSASEQARVAAEKARTAAERAVAEADAAVEEARNRVAEAEAYLEEAKSKPGGQGSLWWIGQELHEAKAYLPASKGGYAKKKVF